MTTSVLDGHPATGSLDASVKAALQRLAREPKQESWHTVVAVTWDGWGEVMVRSREELQRADEEMRRQVAESLRLPPHLVRGELVEKN